MNDMSSNRLILVAVLALVWPMNVTTQAAVSVVNGDFHNDNVGLYWGDDGVLSTPGNPFWNPIGVSTNDLLTENYGVSVVDYTLVNLAGFGFAGAPTHLMFDDYQTNGFEYRLSDLTAGEQYDLALYFEGFNNRVGAAIDVTHDNGIASQTQTTSSVEVLPGSSGQEYLLFSGLEPFFAGVDGYALDIEYIAGAGNLPGLSGFQLRGEMDVAPRPCDVFNPDFETVEPTSGGLPTAIGDWQGDVSQIVTGTTLGITPHNGQRMLQFEGTTFTGAGSNSSQVWQLVDVSHLAAQVAAGQVQVDLEFYANRVAGDAQTDTLFQAVLQAHGGPFSDFPFDIGNFLDIQGTNLLTDSDPDTWELVSASMVLPARTEYVALSVNANENVSDDAQFEYDGHFADSVCLKLQVIPAPGSALLMLLGLVGVAALRWPESRTRSCRRRSLWTKFVVCTFIAIPLAQSNSALAANVAYDDATDVVYNDGWQVSDNGGFGFGPWNIFQIGTASAFVSSSTANGDGVDDGLTRGAPEFAYINRMRVTPIPEPPTCILMLVGLAIIRERVPGTFTSQKKEAERDL